jgi:hypothetical protein
VFVQYGLSVAEATPHHNVRAYRRPSADWMGTAADIARDRLGENVWVMVWTDTAQRRPAAVRRLSRLCGRRQFIEVDRLYEVRELWFVGQVDRRQILAPPPLVEDLVDGYIVDDRRRVR